MLEARDHKTQIIERWFGVLFVFTLALAAHFIFSWRGFNPTDEGIVLAGARRILAGQVPHRDFIFIRPALSMLLHMPEVALGGPYVIWLSRLSFWIQEAAMGWLWIGIIVTLAGIRPLRLTLRIPLALIAFFLSVHTFPSMAWHTVDALFLSTVGLALIVGSSKERGKLLGYAILGAASLCKQNFLPLVPLALLLFGDWRNIRRIAAAVAPGIAYGFYLLLNGALDDALPQMIATSGLWFVAVENYLHHTVFFQGLGVGAVSMLLMQWSTNRHAPAMPMRLAALTLALAGILYFPMIIALHLTDGKLPFGLFGACIGAMIASREWRLILPGVLACAVAWLGSFSSGYQTPALSIGPVAVVLLVPVITGLPTLSLPPVFHPLQRAGVHIIIWCLAAFIGTGFGLYRTHVIYRDVPSKLTKDLGEVLRGGNMIRTNPETYALLANLEQVTKSIPAGKIFTVLPDFAAYWVRSPQENPLPTDWPNSFEISTPALIKWLHQPLFVDDTVQYAIIAKYDAGALPTRRVVPQRVFSTDPVERIYESWSKNVSEPQQQIQDTWKKVKETEYFEVYER